MMVGRDTGTAQSRQRTVAASRTFVPYPRDIARPILRNPLVGLVLGPLFLIALRLIWHPTNFWSGLWKDVVFLGPFWLLLVWAQNRSRRIFFTYSIDDRGISRESIAGGHESIAWSEVERVATEIELAMLYIKIESPTQRFLVYIKEGLENEQSLAFLEAVSETCPLDRFGYCTLLMLSVFGRARDTASRRSRFSSAEKKAYQALAVGNLTRARRRFRRYQGDDGSVLSDWVRLEYILGSYKSGIRERVLRQSPNVEVARKYSAPSLSIRSQKGNDQIPLVAREHADGKHGMRGVVELARLAEDARPNVD